MKLSPSQFQKSLLKWFDAHGRKSLPWQINKTPYRVWVSEIMLQQTQVSTVIPYFERFMQRFPELTLLAEAPEDTVLHLWAGLGYYSRARNLHRAAKTILNELQGIFPKDLDTLQALPGIGRSTAGAILSIALQQPVPILDGNVKRVLTRLFGIKDPINEKRTEIALWDIASRYTSTLRTADYTQAMMDLGATFCTRKKPACHQCPFAKKCVAHLRDQVDFIPAKKAIRKIPTRTATFLIIKKGPEVLLQKRPPSGIWGSLYCLPDLSGEPEPLAINDYCRRHLQSSDQHFTILKSFRHTFSHYHLQIFPVLLEIKKRPRKIMEDGKQIWYNLDHPESIGLPKPIQTILRGLK